MNVSPDSRAMRQAPVHANDSLVPSEHLICMHIINEPMKEEMNESLACPTPNDMKIQLPQRCLVRVQLWKPGLLCLCF